jgi:hypothetical protein
MTVKLTGDRWRKFLPVLKTCPQIRLENFRYIKAYGAHNHKGRQRSKCAAQLKLYFRIEAGKRELQLTRSSSTYTGGGKTTLTPMTHPSTARTAVLAGFPQIVVLESRGHPRDLRA